jgi:ribosomal protein S27AE
MSTHTKPCPRCERGTMLKYDDQWGEYWTCANCGQHEDLLPREPLPHVRQGGYSSA